MLTRDIIVESQHGLHMRVATRIAEISKEHGATVSLINPDNRRANGHSVLDMLTLGAQRGTRLRMIVEGPTEADVVSQLTEILASGGAV